MTMINKPCDSLRILAVDDDEDLLGMYSDFLGADSSEENFELSVCRRGDEALGMVKTAVRDHKPYAAIFLDLNGDIAVGEQIRQADPDLNIVVTGAIRRFAPRIVQAIGPADKLLFVQKPIDGIEIRQLSRALGAKWKSERLLQQTHLELQSKLDELQRSQMALMENKTELETVNRQLLETNDALSVLARNLENTRKESEKQVLRKTRTLIIPTIEKLKQDQRLARYRTDLELLTGYVETLTTDISDKTRNAEVLSATESRIASMIRLGLTSEEIADHLSVSVSTVKTHRKNIRRKLRLKNTGKNLRSYLEARLSSE